MTTYLYETISIVNGEEPKQYEIKQSMTEKALTHHPETGEPIRRIILGGFGIVKKGGSSVSSGGASCGCGTPGCC